MRGYAHVIDVADGRSRRAEVLLCISRGIGVAHDGSDEPADVCLLQAQRTRGCPRNLGPGHAIVGALLPLVGDGCSRRDAIDVCDVCRQSLILSWCTAERNDACSHNALPQSNRRIQDRLSKQSGQCMPAILASACVGQRITRHRRQAKHVVEFAIGEQPSIRGHHRTANWRIRRRSKSRRTESDSPVGFIIPASLDPE